MTQTIDEAQGMDPGTSLQVPARLAELAVIRHFIETSKPASEADPQAVIDLVQAVDEAATNIILHGYHGQPGMIEINIKRSGEALVVTLRDQAEPFNPCTVPAPDFSLPLEKRPLGGMGVHLIRHFCDEMTYRTLPQGGNELTLVKRAALS